MSEDEIFKKVKEIIMDQLGIPEEKITMDTTFTNDLEVDSLDKVELVMNLEDEFHIEISDADAENIETITDVVKYVKSKLDK